MALIGKKGKIALTDLFMVAAILSWEPLLERAKQRLVKEALKSATKSLPISEDSKSLMEQFKKGPSTGLSLPSMGGQ